MTLDASTLEWIRRLPESPESEDIAALLVLRRHATDTRDVRLLDSLLKRSDDGRMSRERTDLTARRRELERRLSSSRAEEREAVADFQAFRLARALHEQARVPARQAEQRARAAISRRDAEQTDRDQRELNEVRRSLRGLHR